MKRLTLILSLMLALVGLNANAAIYIVGDGPLGGWAYNGGNEMTAEGDGTYTYNMTIAENATSATVYFVFADNRGTSWDDFNNNYRIGPTAGGNVKVNAATWVDTQKAGGDNGSYYFQGTKGETYTVTYDETNSRFMVDGYVEPIIGGDTYTVAGAPAALFGTEWAPANTDNDMTLVDGLYTWSKENVELPAGSISFKVAANHDWGEAYPANNYVQTVPVKGIYNVTITFDAETKDVTCDLELVEEIPDTDVHTYTVAGNNTNLFGTSWDETNADNDMTLIDGLYTLTKENVTLTAGNIEFKIVQDHSWGISYPTTGGNVIETIEENGNYNVTITFDPMNKDITFEATIVEEMDDFYTVAGAPASVFGTEWAPGNTANNMTLVDGLYTWAKNDVELAIHELIEFKVLKNANWATSWPTGPNYQYTIPEAGTYDLTITFNPETEEIGFAAVKTGSVEPVHYDGDVYILGEVNDNGGWFTNVGVKMTRDEENNIYTATITTTGEAYVDPETNIGYSYFGFTKQLAETANDWDAIAPYRFGAVSEGNFWITEDVLGDIIPLKNNGETLQIPAGTWNLTVSVDNMTLVVEKVASDVLPGDVDGDEEVAIADVAVLIDYLLTGDASGIVLANADCDGDGEVAIADVAALIDYLLVGNW